MAKIKNDKYYTSPELAKYCVEKTKEIIGEENITEWIEPSGGNGVFLNYLPKGTYSCDIEPEDDRIEKQDYLTLDLEYKKGRCVIGNPPFGRANSLLKMFYKKSTKISNYIAFILPVSQFNNNNELYQFDLIYSENLGIKKYTNKDIHCCFNIYKKPLKLKNKPKYNYKDIKIIGWRKCKNKNIKCDFYICCYGSKIGKIVEKNCDLVNLNGIQIKNKKLYNKIYNIFKNTNWCDIYPMTSTPNLLQWQVYKYLKEQIPELE